MAFDTILNTPAEAEAIAALEFPRLTKNSPRRVREDYKLLAPTWAILTGFQRAPQVGGNPVGFAMEAFFDVAPHGCGTTACIAGFMSLLNERGDVVMERGAVAFAQRHHELAYAMCEDRQHHFTGVTSAQAASALKNYIETGYCGWDAILTPVQKKISRSYYAKRAGW